MWAADPAYLHDTLRVENGPILHFLYKNDPEIIDNWKNLQPKAVEAMQFLQNNIGEYPYEQYSVIQGGDGGMEYAMGTLIVGGGSFNGLVGVTVHEMAHSWFQHILANNELKHGWMDEGFTEFIETLCKDSILGQNKQNRLKRITIVIIRLPPPEGSNHKPHMQIDLTLTSPTVPPFIIREPFFWHN